MTSERFIELLKELSDSMPEPERDELINYALELVDCKEWE